MDTCRKLLVGNHVTAFDFANYESPAVVVKNETDGEILFCDVSFNENKAVHIPAHSWQKLSVKLFSANPASFFVRSAVSGYVEIDMGSDGIGCLDVMVVIDKAGLIPHVLTFTAGENTTLTAVLQREHGSRSDLNEPTDMQTGATVFTGDTVKFTATCSLDGNHAVLTVNNVIHELAQDGTCVVTISGDTVAVTAAEANAA